MNYTHSNSVDSTACFVTALFRGACEQRNLEDLRLRGNSVAAHAGHSVLRVSTAGSQTIHVPIPAVGSVQCGRKRQFDRADCHERHVRFLVLHDAKKHETYTSSEQSTMARTTP